METEKPAWVQDFFKELVEMRHDVAELAEMRQDVATMKQDVARLRDAQIDQQLQQDSLIKSMAFGARGGLLSRQPNLSSDGHAFKTRIKDLKPSSIY